MDPPHNPRGYGIYRQHEIDRDCEPAVKLVEWDLMGCPIIEPDESP